MVKSVKKKEEGSEREKVKKDRDNKQNKAKANNINVVVRVRPFLSFEAGNRDCVEVLAKGDDGGFNTIQVDGKDKATFTFDAAYPSTSSQSDMFSSIIPLVDACLDGYNATVLAYGQTGSGKTHTILGEVQRSSDGKENEEAGVIPRALREIFSRLKDLQADAVSDPLVKNEYKVKVQFLELYGENIRDLLSEKHSNKSLAIRDGNGSSEPEVIGASEVEVFNADDALLCLTRGTLRRVTRATAMNSESSRSHAIMSVIIHQKSVEEGESSKESVTMSKTSRFHFVDLAGSERAKRTGATGQGMKEGININKGLLVLGNVISALGDPRKRGKAHVPYRDSKLTRLLKGSLGGNHRTLMIACVSPSSSNSEETTNTLRYANRAKNIKNKAEVNIDAGSKLVAELRQQVRALAGELLNVHEGISNSGLSEKTMLNVPRDTLLQLVGMNELKRSYPTNPSMMEKPIVNQSQASIVLNNCFESNSLFRGNRSESDLSNSSLTSRSSNISCNDFVAVSDLSTESLKLDEKQDLYKEKYEAAVTILEQHTQERKVMLLTLRNLQADLNDVKSRKERLSLDVNAKTVKIHTLEKGLFFNGQKDKFPLFNILNSSKTFRYFENRLNTRTFPSTISCSSHHSFQWLMSQIREEEGKRESKIQELAKLRKDYDKFCKNIEKIIKERSESKVAEAECKSTSESMATTGLTITGIDFTGFERENHMFTSMTQCLSDSIKESNDFIRNLTAKRDKMVASPPQVPSVVVTSDENDDDTVCSSIASSHIPDTKSLSSRWGSGKKNKFMNRLKGSQRSIIQPLGFSKTRKILSQEKQELNAMMQEIHLLDSKFSSLKELETELQSFLNSKQKLITNMEGRKKLIKDLMQPTCFC